MHSRSVNRNEAQTNGQTDRRKRHCNESSCPHIQFVCSKLSAYRQIDRYRYIYANLQIRHTGGRQECKSYLQLQYEYLCPDVYFLNYNNNDSIRNYNNNSNESCLQFIIEWIDKQLNQLTYCNNNSFLSHCIYQACYKYLSVCFSHICICICIYICIHCCICDMLCPKCVILWCFFFCQ